MVESMNGWEDAIDAYDVDIMMGRSHEEAFRFAVGEFGVSLHLVSHYLREIGDASVGEKNFSKAVVDFVTSWTVHSEQWRIRHEAGMSSFMLDHELVADDLMFCFTRRFPKYRLFQLRDGISRVIEIVMLVNLRMFVPEDES